MFCPKCGRINPDEEVLCKGCGAVLHEETEEKNTKKRGIGVKVAKVVVLLAVLVGAVSFSITSCEKEEAFMAVPKDCITQG